MTAVSLPSIPQGAEFEELVSACLQLEGYFIERNIIDRGDEEVLELDVIATDYDQSPPATRLFEAKSGEWGFPDVFKLRGWMDYLNISSGALVVAQDRGHFDFCRKIASSLGIELIKADVAADPMKALCPSADRYEGDDTDAALWRYAYWVERALLRRLNKLRRSQTGHRRFDVLADYHHEVNSRTFFSPTIPVKLSRLYDAFQQHPRVSAKVGHELIGDPFDDEHEGIPEPMFRETYYDCKLNDIQVSTLIEHKARLSILKSAVDYILYKNAGNLVKVSGTFKIVAPGAEVELPVFDLLPKSFRMGLEQLSHHKYLHRYPVFWQWFTWVFGGFILTDYADREYELLSRKTGIPVGEIDNALKAYDLLFPVDGGWFRDLSPVSRVRVLQLFSVPLMGVGANYRRLRHTVNGTYEELENGGYTVSHLAKWNNLLVDLLRGK